MSRQSFTSNHQARSQSSCVQAVLCLPCRLLRLVSRKESVCSCIFRCDVQGRGYYTRGLCSCFCTILLTSGNQGREAIASLCHFLPPSPALLFSSFTVLTERGNIFRRMAFYLNLQMLVYVISEHKCIRVDLTACLYANCTRAYTGPQTTLGNLRHV